MSLDDPTILQFSVPYQLVPSGRDTVRLIASGSLPVTLESSAFSMTRLCEMLNRGCSKDDLLEVGGDAVRVRRTVESLVKRGLVRRLAPAPEDLQKLIPRWQRQISAFRKYETSDCTRYDVFRRIRNARVVLIGVGGLASWCLQHLVAAGLGRIVLVDFDRVEESNLSRQSLFLQEHVGRKKIDAAADMIGKLSTHTTVDAVDQRVNSETDITKLVERFHPIDLVILTADRPIWGISVWASHACGKAKIPLLRGNSNGVGPIMVLGETACPACEWPALKETFEDAEEIIRYYRTEPRSSVVKSALSTEIALAGTLLADEALHHLATTGDFSRRDRKSAVRNKLGLEVKREPKERHPNCEVCGEAAAV